jgi:hypothetical protein
MDSPSWEDSIDFVVKNIKAEYFKYIASDDFEFEWKHYWSTHFGGLTSRFRRELRRILSICDEGYVRIFAIETETTRIIKHVIEHSIISQFDIIYRLERDNDMEWIRKLGRDVIDDAIGCLESYATHSLYAKLSSEYKKYWHSAEKIQIQWRKSISDPKYVLCQKRLKKEFEELAK